MPTPEETREFLAGLNTSQLARARAYALIQEAPVGGARAERLVESLPFSDQLKRAIWAMHLDKGTGGPSALHEVPGVGVAPPGASTPDAPASASRRFFSNVAEVANPVSVVRGMASAVANPIDTAKAIVGSHVETGGKALGALRQGRYSEALGYAGATALPVMGPFAASVGEQAGSGDVAGAMGRLVGGALIRGGATRVPPVVRRAGRSLKRGAVEQVTRALAPQKELYKARAERIVPQYLNRGLVRNVREGLLPMSEVLDRLSAQAGSIASRIGEAINAEAAKLTQSGVTVNIRTAIDGLRKAMRENEIKGRATGTGVESTVKISRGAAVKMQKYLDDMERLPDQVPLWDAVRLRRGWDSIVEQAGGWDHRRPGGVSPIGRPLAQSSEALAAHTASNLLRKQINSSAPTVQALNQQFGFYNGLHSIAQQTAQRILPQDRSLLSRVSKPTGAVIGAASGSMFGPAGAGVGAMSFVALQTMYEAVTRSPQWRLVSAQTKHALGNAMQTRNAQRAGQLMGDAMEQMNLHRVTGADAAP